MRNLRIHTSALENSKYVKVIGKFSSVDAMMYKHKLSKLPTSAHMDMTMDLTEVTELDIAGLNTLLQLHRLLSKSNAELRLLLSDNREQYELFSLTKFDQYLNVSYAA